MSTSYYYKKEEIAADVIEFLCWFPEPVALLQLYHSLVEGVSIKAQNIFS